MNPDQDILLLISTGEKIEAIKAYRERYGVGLREAKEAVDAAEAGAPLPVPVGPENPDFWAAIDACLRSGNKIEAIKLYRERTGIGLKEAKDAVEARAGADPTLQVKQGCFIATAAYGSPLAAEVVILRRFRDRVLLRNPAGRLFVRCYYRLSPALAERVRASSSTRGVVRSLLKPLIRLCTRGSERP